MSEIADRYRTLADAFEAKVAAVAPDAWSNRSPCDEWDARQLVGHVIDVHGMMLRPLGRTLSEGPDDPLGAFKAARADVQAVLDDPALAGAEYDGRFGKSKVEDTIDRFMGFDLVVHGWDLARATGQDERRGSARTCTSTASPDRTSRCPMTRRSRTACSDCLGASRDLAESSGQADQRGWIVDLGGVGLEVAHGELAEGDGIGGVELLGGVEHAVCFGRPVEVVDGCGHGRHCDRGV